jgi:outer membrane protein W
MKKILALLIVFISNYTQAYTPPSFDDVIVEFRTSYFYPSSSRFRQIFDRQRINYQLTGSFPICHAWWSRLNLWTAVNYLSLEGRSTGIGDRTSLRMIPVTLGLKYFLPSLCCKGSPDFYIAGGMKYYFVHNYNDSNYVQKSIDRKGWGGVAEVGCLFSIRDCYVLDLFAAYSFKSFHGPSSSNPYVISSRMKLDGFDIGVGVGYRF